jgi:hypothetical protein
MRFCSDFFPHLENNNEVALQKKNLYFGFIVIIIHNCCNVKILYDSDDGPKMSLQHTFAMFFLMDNISKVAAF